MTLADLQERDLVQIKEVKNDFHLKRRLYDLGFFPGVSVECVIISPFYSPILYKVNGAFIALRKEEAKKIEVTYAN
ncbi:MAG: ferrous iron transport protein A [Bacilli bacterium]|nr:ferrous iron transport protein A [Bacilli bacterium]